MKISYNWLKEYVSKLPKPEKLAELLTMHSVEVEDVKEVRLPSEKSDFVFDVDVLPNRTHDCLSHIGIARECAALTGQTLSVKESAKIVENLKEKDLKVEIKNNKLCSRYIGRVVDGIKVEQSPQWLKKKLEILGQKSINNIVDATNYIMLETGQPLHAFDFEKIAQAKIVVRSANKGEKITTLDNEKYELDKDVLVIADAKDPLAIAGVKGGKKAEIDNKTKTIVLEAANFIPINIRKTSRKISLQTEASVRFENEISPELAEMAIDRLTALIQKLLSSKKIEIGEKVDIYPRRANPFSMGLKIKNVTELLGVEVPEKEITNILQLLDFKVKKIDTIKNVLKLAKNLEGTPYKYGASVTYDAPNHFDCSSFTSYLFAQSGIQIPRMSIDQYFYGQPVEKKDLKPGDLVFSNTKEMIHGVIHYQSKEFIKGLKEKEGVDHCGLYLGAGKVIHTATSKEKVVIEDLQKAEHFKNLRGFRRAVSTENSLLIVEVPFGRIDVRNEEDLIEEIGRLYGYGKIKAQKPLGLVRPVKQNNSLILKNKTKNILSGAGMTEVYNFSFVGDKDLEKTGDSSKNYIELAKPLSFDLQYLRRDLITSLLKNTKENFKYTDNLKLFNIGKVYYKSESKNQSKANEKLMLAGILGQKKGGDELFYEAKGITDILFNKLGITELWYDSFKVTPEWTEKKLWDLSKSAEIKVGNEEIGLVGEINTAVLSKFGIKEKVVAFNFDFEKILKLEEKELIYQKPSKYPAIIRDISILVNPEDKVVEVMNVINRVGGELVRDVDLFDIYEGPTGEQKNFAFHVIYQSDERTLTDKEVEAVHNKIIKELETNINWETRK